MGLQSITIFSLFSLSAVGQLPLTTRVEPVMEVLHGEEIVDSYRWLEDQESSETRDWIDRQNAYTDTVLGQIPGRDGLRRLAESVLKRNVVGVPVERGGRYFFSKRNVNQALAVVYVRKGAEGTDEVLIDPHTMSLNHTTSVSLRSISKDGKWVAYAIRKGGVDEVSVKVRNVDTGDDLPDVLPTARYSQILLASDGKGIYYDRFGDVTPRVMYHRFGSPMSEDTMIFGEGDKYGPQHIVHTEISNDGRWMSVHIVEGKAIEIYVKDLENDTPFVTAIEHRHSAWSESLFVGDQLVIKTNYEAPNSRVVLVDPKKPQVTEWREIVPEREGAVVQSVVPMGGKLAISYLNDVQQKVAIYELDGTYVRDIEFDSVGSISIGSGRWGSSEAFFTFQTFHVPSTTYRYDLSTEEQRVWAEPESPVEKDAYQAVQRWYNSKDGTRVPLFIVHSPDITLDGSNPVLMTGYGGFGANLMPRFSAQATTWLKTGGIFVQVNLRGGGEFGQEWHDAGRRGNKQNVFDDFIAAAEFLIREGYTSSDKLAIMGGSNGGLLVSAVSNQRPELFEAVICAYPLLDMIRYHQFLAARFWVSEYGSSEDAEQFAWLRAYSPYHNIIEDGNYPATLYVSGDGDTLVAPLHARKMAALMQAKSGSDNPILLRYHTQAGHSGGQPVEEQIDDIVDMVSFLLEEVGR